MNIRLFILIVSLGWLSVSCADKYGDFEVSETGLMYKIVDNNRNTGRKPKVGDVLELRYSYETESGNVLFNSSESERKYMKKLEFPAHTGGSIEDGLSMLQEGDSALFKIQAGNFLLFSEKYGHLPTGVDTFDPIIVKVRLVDIMDENEIDLYMSSRYHTSEEQESEILKDYIAKSNIEATPTASGLYFIEKNVGDGKTIKNGDFVTLNYTLTLVDGSLVETTLGQAPMSYVVGRERFIEGWEEAVRKMSKGTTATVIIPSKLAYGAEGKGNILPYSTLIFEIEIIDVK